MAAGVDQLDHAKQKAGMAAVGECGDLRIGVPLVPRSYREAYPDVEIEMMEGTAREDIMQHRAIQVTAG